MKGRFNEGGFHEGGAIKGACCEGTLSPVNQQADGTHPTGMHSCFSVIHSISKEVY